MASVTGWLAGREADVSLGEVGRGPDRMDGLHVTDDTGPDPCVRVVALVPVHAGGRQE